jgi:periplasmic protein CpxP/Spy
MDVGNTPESNMLRPKLPGPQRKFPALPAQLLHERVFLLPDAGEQAGGQGKKMKNWKRSVLMAALGAALALPAAFAQANEAPAGPPAGAPQRHKNMEARHKQMEERMAKELGLTDTQRAELKAFHEQQKAKMDALRDNDQLTREEKRAQMKSLMEERKAKMDSILTAEQKTKWKELRKEHRGMHGKRGGVHGGRDDKGPGGAGSNN